MKCPLFCIYFYYNLQSDPSKNTVYKIATRPHAALGDTVVTEDEVRKLSKLILSFVDMRERRQMLSTYKDAFLGR